MAKPETDLHRIDIPTIPGSPSVPHIFRQEDLDAINAALAARRPLLLYGEPGVGKTQLARAAAWDKRRVFFQKVVDSRTEARDLKWTEDLVARLADAQMVGSMPKLDAADKVRRRLHLRNYIKPGPLWWGFNWASAECQAKRAQGETPPIMKECSWENGAVILIDEIDKAEAELPNGLLEALGAQEFTPLGWSEPIRAERWPLVVVTSNEERVLPDAFIRRCIVHIMRPPEEEEAFIAWLMERGGIHFPSADPALLKEAARQTFLDRKACEERHLRPLPGQAEYLDLLRAILSNTVAQELSPMERLTRLKPYFLKKHPDLR